MKTIGVLILSLIFLPVAAQRYTVVNIDSPTFEKQDRAKIASDSLDVLRKGSKGTTRDFPKKHVLGFSNTMVIKDSIDDHKSNNKKNYIGLRSFGPIGLGNISILYGRTFVLSKNYQFTLEPHFFWGYKFRYSADRLGGLLTVNHFFGKNKHKFVLSTGVSYSITPAFTNAYQTWFVCGTGACVPKRSVGTVFGLGWRYNIRKKFALQISYWPSLYWDKIQPYDKDFMEWRTSPYPFDFDLSVYYYF